ncbi:hypothetical protein [Burkholderia multivorans]|uniref:hypothetical protein n=1 Tax=Burkholderia multivorans TaxID=87883 RepID=UPI0028659C37|nr:hypothetical protein [Burkholderia multivorans]MDR8976076.1 hypothetical protein [Burkholderia multivorans]
MNPTIPVRAVVFGTGYRSCVTQIHELGDWLGEPDRPEEAEDREGRAQRDAEKQHVAGASVPDSLVSLRMRMRHTEELRCYHRFEYEYEPLDYGGNPRDIWIKGM